MITFRFRYWLAAVLGLSIVHSVPAEVPRSLALNNPASLTPTSASSDNQKLAETIAEHLRQSGQLRYYAIDVAVHNGLAELSGYVADEPQRDEVLHIVHGVPGVERVVDRLSVSGGAGTITRVQGGVPPAPLKDPIPSGPSIGDAPPGKDAGPVSPNDAAAPGGKVEEPTPIFQAPPSSPYDLNPPRMPPYAWPTYAPYNNYSRVAYPLAYPYQSWPFIGPCYPFPKIPLGWRSVRLEWQDGHWWFKKNATGNDWWRIRYW